ncbi:MAG: hypothetical protein K0U70_15330 [Actinomycetia bacterium]|nr:hypothetical protein [Actinomycetes bacterium]MCH9769158.1 hypothetical protein [Actinomycetes bacterium]
MTRLLLAVAAAALAIAAGRRNQLRRQTSRKSVMDTFTLTPGHQPKLGRDDAES